MSKPFHPPANKRLDHELYCQPERVTFITIRSFNYQRPFINTPLNRMVINTLLSGQENLNCQVYTYCLMPDHIHYLMSPREEGCSVLRFTDQFKGKTTHLSWDCGWSGKLWQPRYYDHMVRTGEDLYQISEYILANPVRKGLVGTAQEWPWSGTGSVLPV